jgi:hypothetical protein
MSEVPQKGEALSSWLEELDRIAVRIFQLNLLTARTDLHRVAERQSGLFQPVNLCGEIGDLKDDAVPSARLLMASIWHGPGARRLRSAEQQLQIAERDSRECGKLLMFQREAKVLRVELHRAAHVPDLIAHAVHAESATLSGRVMGYGRGFSLGPIHKDLLIAKRAKLLMSLFQVRSIANLVQKECPKRCLAIIEEPVKYLAQGTWSLLSATAMPGGRLASP